MDASEIADRLIREDEKTAMGFLLGTMEGDMFNVTDVYRPEQKHSHRYTSCLEDGFSGVQTYAQEHGLTIFGVAAVDIGDMVVVSKDSVRSGMDGFRATMRANEMNAFGVRIVKTGKGPEVYLYDHHKADNGPDMEMSSYAIKQLSFQ